MQNSYSSFLYQLHSCKGSWGVGNKVGVTVDKGVLVRAGLAVWTLIGSAVA